MSKLTTGSISLEFLSYFSPVNAILSYPGCSNCTVISSAGFNKFSLGVETSRGTEGAEGTGCPLPNW